MAFPETNFHFSLPSNPTAYIDPSVDPQKIVCPDTTGEALISSPVWNENNSLGLSGILAEVVPVNWWLPRKIDHDDWATAEPTIKQQNGIINI